MAPDAADGFVCWLLRSVASAAVGDQPPINFLITKWAGPKPALEPFAERWGMACASLPDEDFQAGMAALRAHAAGPGEAVTCNVDFFVFAPDERAQGA